MKLIKKSAAVLLLALGTLLLISGAYAPFNHKISREERVNEGMACLLFGLPMTGVGGWLIWSLHRQNYKEVKQRIDSRFYELLKLGHGNITVMEFALEAQLTKSVAKQYLDEKARDFDATFTVSEDGEVYYCFPLRK